MVGNSMWHFIVFGVTNGRHFVLISRVYEQHPASRLETKHQTGIPCLQQIAIRAI